MDSDKYLEGQSMQRPPLFESDSFIYWKNRFETYVKSKDLDLWHVITNGDFQPIIQNPETKLDEVVPFENQTDDLKRRLAKNNEAKMVIYNALPRKEYERIFMCNTAKEIWKTLLITHQGSMKIEQYLTLTDHALWVGKIETKSKSILAIAIPDEHLLKFHACKDAKSLWEAIKNRFGGNKESKKMQKTILKQNYENFAASSQEGLDKTYDRFQKLISQLEIHGEVISQEDANLKLLRSLPSTWNNIALIMRNKSDLDTLSMDDLYNNLKVYKAEIKGKSSSSSNSQNVAFVSSENTSNTNEAVNTAHDVSAASSQGQASSSTYADDVMFSFFANQSNSP
ncbi:hypothetical protein Tco_1309489 [Tanacetum coccineum]